MMTCVHDTPLLAAAGGEPIAALGAGERFAVLDMSGGWAWGYRVAERRVGYVEASALRA